MNHNFPLSLSRYVQAARSTLTRINANLLNAATMRSTMAKVNNVSANLIITELCGASVYLILLNALLMKSGMERNAFASQVRPFFLSTLFKRHDASKALMLFFHVHFFLNHYSQDAGNTHTMAAHQVVHRRSPNQAATEVVNTTVDSQVVTGSDKARACQSGHQNYIHEIKILSSAPITYQHALFHLSKVDMNVLILNKNWKTAVAAPLKVMEKIALLSLV